ncbi:glycosyltransferase family 1 protein [Raoultella terrigena]|uniref:glycosyltransferase family 4 protein n=1 Tax=Raoultella terrigena TaxID=577 RepID=UPI0025AFB0DD|nr:glycosyltransferase family 1 protein [Raoultella terrigena]WJV40590.1 glycosyltransferase family 1 protein [Raoultella terrigena]
MNEIIFDSRWFGTHGIGRFAKEVFSGNPSFTKIKMKGNPASKYDSIKLTLYLLFHKGIYFTPGYNSPLLFLSRTYITVHDLNHIDVESNSSWLKRIYYNLILKRACRKAKAIFTVSTFTKERIAQWSGRCSDDIIVVSNGVSEVFNVNAAPYSCDFDYILMVGNRKKHKNEKKGIEVFLKANIDKEIKLIITGESSKELLDVIHKHDADNRVIFLGKVDEEVLASLYKSAIFLFFPSIYEGFGLPVVESMACGTPVVTSNLTSLPEVAGNAAVYVDPYDFESMRNGVELVANDRLLRNDLSKKGLDQIKKFTWESTKARINSII